MQTSYESSFASISKADLQGPLSGWEQVSELWLDEGLLLPFSYHLHAETGVDIWGWGTVEMVGSRMDTTRDGQGYVVVSTAIWVKAF